VIVVMRHGRWPSVFMLPVGNVSVGDMTACQCCAFVRGGVGVCAWVGMSL
jgi:hypothetical protein